ncbi:hypothetical protein PG984_010230 [Apiospora sp. TS-2023a]
MPSAQQGARKQGDEVTCVAKGLQILMPIGMRPLEPARMQDAAAPQGNPTTCPRHAPRPATIALRSTRSALPTGFQAGFQVNEERCHLLLPGKLYLQQEFPSPGRPVPNQPSQSRQIMEGTPEQQQQPTWPAASITPPPRAPTRRTITCPQPSWFNDGSRARRHDFGLTVTRNPLMDPMSPEHLALVVETVEKHHILEAHHGLAQSARSSARRAARRRAVLKNSLLLCVLGLLCATVWGLMKNWCHPRLRYSWVTDQLDGA